MSIAIRDSRKAKPVANVQPARIRLALFSGNYNCVRDGANQALNRLVGHMLDSGHADVRVYSPTVREPAFDPTGDLVSVRSIPIPGRSEYRLAVGLPGQIVEDLDTFRPNIIHVSAPDRLGLKAQLYAQDRGIPIVASLHTRFETYFEYYGLGFLRNTIERYLDRFYGRCERVLVPNRPIAEEFHAAGFAERTRIWGRGVDQTVFSPKHRDLEWRRRLGIAEDEVVILLFGRLVLEKGLEMFCRAIDGARARGYKLRPLIVGDGPERKFVAKRLPDAIFMGHLSGAELGRAVASADIFLNPSMTEAFGNVTLEAMAAGVPILSADVPSASALVEHGRSAFLVQPTSLDAYVEGLDVMVRNPAFRHRLAKAALADAARYEWPQILSAVFDAYQECLVTPGNTVGSVA